MIEIYRDKWDLKVVEKIADTKTSQIYRVEHGAEIAVLKIFSPIGKKFESQSAEFLRLVDGHGVVRVIQSTEDALLLEDVDGQKLASLVRSGEDEKSTEIICDVLDAIHSHSRQQLPGFVDLNGHFQSLMKRAEKETSGSIFKNTAKVAKELIRTESDRTMLHGDIHHTNILFSAERGWLAIDPQPLFGERTYDTANAFYNPDDLPMIVESTDRVLSMARRFSNRMRVDQKRVLKFAYAHGGLSISWQLDDGEDPARRMRIVKIIESLLQ